MPNDWQPGMSTSEAAPSGTVTKRISGYQSFAETRTPTSCQAGACYAAGSQAHNITATFLPRDSSALQRNDLIASSRRPIVACYAAAIGRITCRTSVPRVLCGPQNTRRAAEGNREKRLHRHDLPGNLTAEIRRCYAAENAAVTTYLAEHTGGRIT